MNVRETTRICPVLATIGGKDAVDVLLDSIVFAHTFFQASVFSVQPILFFGQSGIFLAQLSKVGGLVTDARCFQNPRLRFKENDFALTSAQILFLVTGFLVFAIQRLYPLVDGETNLSFYGTWCLIAAAGYMLKVLFATWSTSVSHTATFQVLRDIRKMMISKLSRLPMGAILDKPSGEMKDTIVDRVDSLETTLPHIVPEITANLLAPILLIVYLFAIDWRMALISLITIPVGMVFAVSMTKNYPKQY